MPTITVVPDHASTQRLSPPLRKRRLGALLRGLRHDRGLTLEDVARRVGWHRATLSRVETGDTRVRPGRVRELLDVYRVDAATRARCLELNLQSQVSPWWNPYRRVLSAEFIALETEATRIRMFQPLLIPGLLQTREYARAVFAAVHGDSCPLLTTRVQARMARQALLKLDDPVELDAVIGEYALRRPVGGDEVLRRQLDMLVRLLNDLPHLTLRVLPDDVAAHPGLYGPFELLDTSDGCWAFFETPIEVVSEDAAADSIRRFDLLVEMALSPVDSQALVKCLLEEKNADRTME